ncbi:MAG: Maf family nucleotide pyrophosphatase [Rikenellaceae bacterium]
MIETLNNYNITLFSASPRRKELLEGIGLKFKVASLDVDETFPTGLTPIEAVKHISRQKLSGYSGQIGKRDIIITADTIVVVGEKILGKPLNRTHAIEMLAELSGREHSVITGFTITSYNSSICNHSETRVKFRKLTNDEIEYYVDNYKPYDKAGSYGIQEWIGYIGIEAIEGSFYNVMGLPVQLIYKELLGIINKI